MSWSLQTSAGWQNLIGVGDWTPFTTLSASSGFTDTPPQAGVHLVYEFYLRMTTAVQNMQIVLQGDDSTGNYHWQRSAAQNGAANVPEGSTFDMYQIVASTGVALYFSPVSIVFPYFRTPSIQKNVLIVSAFESAAANQTCMFVSGKRQTAGVGALEDIITTVTHRPTSGAINGAWRRKVTF